MKTAQKQFNFQLPEKVLNNLRTESEETGIPISAIIKTRIAQKSKIDFLFNRAMSGSLQPEDFKEGEASA